MSAQALVAATLPRMPSVIPGLRSKDPVFMADMDSLWQILHGKWHGGADRRELGESVRAAMRVHPGKREDIAALAIWFAYINDTNGLGELDRDWPPAGRSEPGHISNLIPGALAGLLDAPAPGGDNDDNPPF